MQCGGLRSFMPGCASGELGYLNPKGFTADATV